MTDLPPGRELDAAIADRIFGWTGIDPTAMWSQWEYGDPGDEWTLIKEPWCRGLGRPPDHKYGQRPYPRYSEKIAEAWHVVDRLTSTTKQWFRLDVFSTGCVATFEISGAGERDFTASADGFDVPHAICLAALRVAGEAL
jgi:Phage ABA sandwich domain